MMCNSNKTDPHLRKKGQKGKKERYIDVNNKSKEDREKNSALRSMRGELKAKTEMG